MFLYFGQKFENCIVVNVTDILAVKTWKVVFYVLQKKRVNFICFMDRQKLHVPLWCVLIGYILYIEVTGNTVRIGGSLKSELLTVLYATWQYLHFFVWGGTLSQNAVHQF